MGGVIQHITIHAGPPSDRHRANQREPGRGQLTRLGLLGDEGHGLKQPPHTEGRRETPTTHQGNANARSSAGLSIVAAATQMYCFPLSMYDIGLPVGLAGKVIAATTSPVRLS